MTLCCEVATGEDGETIENESPSPVEPYVDTGRLPVLVGGDGVAVANIGDCTEV